MDLFHSHSNPVNYQPNLQMKKTEAQKIKECSQEHLENDRTGVNVQLLSSRVWAFNNSTASALMQSFTIQTVGPALDLYSFIMFLSLFFSYEIFRKALPPTPLPLCHSPSVPNIW